MKKLVVSLAVLGLVGVSPVSAHKAEGVKCTAKLLGVTYEPGDKYQIVETRVSVKNTSDHKLKPEVDAGIYSANGNWVADHELPAHKLDPGEVQRQRALTNLDPSINVEDVRVDHCHKTWHFDS